MSSSSFIDINLSKDIKIDAVSAIKALPKYGWELTDGKYIGYLPLGDKDNFHWKFVPLKMKDKVLEELERKQNAGEVIGVMVKYKNTKAGANLLYLPSENQISFSLTESTELENGINDFTFYEEKLLPWIRGEKIQYNSIYLAQTDSGGQLEFEKKILGDG
jgi:hypothetical protein